MFVSSDNKPNPPNLPKMQPMLRFQNPSDLEYTKAVQHTQFYYCLYYLPIWAPEADQYSVTQNCAKLL